VAKNHQSELITRKPYESCELLSEQTRGVSRLQLLDRQAGGFLGLRGGPANITALEASGLEQCIAHLIGFLRTLRRGLCATENLSLDFPSGRLGLANIVLADVGILYEAMHQN